MSSGHSDKSASRINADSNSHVRPFQSRWTRDALSSDSSRASIWRVRRPKPLAAAKGAAGIRRVPGISDFSCLEQQVERLSERHRHGADLPGAGIPPWHVLTKGGCGARAPAAASGGRLQHQHCAAAAGCQQRNARAASDIHGERWRHAAAQVGLHGAFQPEGEAC